MKKTNNEETWEEPMIEDRVIRLEGEPLIRSRTFFPEILMSRKQYLGFTNWWLFSMVMLGIAIFLSKIFL